VGRSLYYGQYRQELENRASSLYKFQPTTILFAFDALHLVSGISGPLSVAGTKSVVVQLIKRIQGLWSIAKNSLGAHVIQQTVLPTATRLVGSNEHGLPWSQASLTRQINSELRVAADAAGVDLLSVDEAIEIVGLDTWFDQSLWHKAKQEIRPTAAPIYGDWVGRILAARQGRSSKCLVFDLDNTLWSGVIGDDGLGGIVLGEGNAIGEAHKAFQAYARNLAQRGVILAVCSKNDEANAKLPFTSHPEMVLKLDDIACFVANWADKATNLRAIASSLNISLDSLVFVDDNPFERNIVRRELPMVMVPELPEDPSLYVRCVADAGYFELAQITEEDFARSQQYQANLTRQGAMNAATDLKGF
jgi:HAD superfamily phosphatase (TIGR01681 family)